MAGILRPVPTEQRPSIAVGETLHATRWDSARAGRNPLAKRRLPRWEEARQCRSAVDLQTASTDGADLVSQFRGEQEAKIGDVVAPISPTHPHRRDTSGQSEDDG